MTRLAFVFVLALVGRASAAPLPTTLEVDEHPGARVQAELPFVDAQGQPVQLGDFLHGDKPVLLVLAYFHCPMLCDLVLRGIASSVAKQGLVLGRDFEALTVSFDPSDTPDGAARKQGALLQAIGHPEAVRDWPFLVGKKPAIDRLAATLGFAYVHDEKSGQYAHSAVAFVLTPDGRVSRYLYGVTFRPLDVRMALNEAARGKVGGFVDRVLLTCFHYDPTSRRYAFYVRNGLRAGAALTLLVMMGGLALIVRRGRREQP
ncbi:MAG: SCO family protein [Polyangia bacterium]